jgi:hypothetical protein
LRNPACIYLINFYAARMQYRYAICFLLPLLAGCQGNDVRNALGLEREAPDEFVVYSRPPLSLPPEFELRPPRPGEPPRLREDAREQARETVLGATKEPTGLKPMSPTAIEEPVVETAVSPVITTNPKTTAESRFLDSTGARNADPEIREKLQQSDPRDTQDAQTLFEKIVRAKESDPLVDPTKEVERLRTNRQQGKPVTEGDVPTIDTTPKTVLDTLF